MSVVIIFVDLHLRQILLQPLYILFFTVFRKLRVESGTVKPSTIDIFKRPINSHIAMIFTFSIYVHIYVDRFEFSTCMICAALKQV